MKTITCICMEDTPGYPDPLIYTVDHAELMSEEQIAAAVLEQRVAELGEEERDYLTEHFRVCLAYEGDIHSEALVFDHRS